jgi:hypothetical protein
MERKPSLKAMPLPLLWLPLPTRLSLPRVARRAHLASSVDLRRMAFPARPRSWSPTCLTTSARRRYVFVVSCSFRLAALLTLFSQLLEIFKDYSPTAAKIALRPIPKFMVRKLQARNEPRKGRGFGFVTLSSEELQQKACNEMNGREIEGREIAVKVAIDSPGKEDEDPSTAVEPTLAAEGVSETPAATTA